LILAIGVLGVLGWSLFTDYSKDLSHFSEYAQKHSDSAIGHFRQLWRDHRSASQVGLAVLFFFLLPYKRLTKWLHTWREPELVRAAQEIITRLRIEKSATWT